MVNTKLLGLFLLILFAVSQGLRDVYLSSAFGTVSFFDLVFLAFSTATIFFCLLLVLFARNDIPKLKEHWRGVLAVNLTTAVAWLCYFGALNLVEPSAVSTVFSGIAPVAVVLLTAIGLYASDKANAAPMERLLHVGIFSTLLFLGWIVLSGRSGFAEISVFTGLTGLLLAAISGVAITAETVYAKQMNEAGISAIGVLSLRFVLIALIGGVAVYGYGQTSLDDASLGTIGTISFKMLMLMVAPLYLVGKGLQLTSPLTTGIVAAFGPAIVFSLQAAEGRIPTSYWVLSVTVIYVLLTTGSVALRAYLASKAKA